MNRLTEYFEPFEEGRLKEEFFEIAYRYSGFIVTKETAIEIERQLDQRPPPRWIVFTDLYEARHRILSEGITRISESTAEQRAASREFDRARRLEEKQDRRPWEDDD